MARTASERRKWDRDYQRRRRAAGLAWDQQPENAGRARERKREWHRERYANDPEYRERECERQRERKRNQTYRGLCSNCGQPKLSEWYCWDCLIKKDFAEVKRKARELGIDDLDDDPDQPLAPLRGVG